MKFPFQFSLADLLKLTRIWNLTIIVIAQYFTAGLLIHAPVFDWRLLILVSSTVMIAAAGYIINDYYDVKIDLINKPERVVVGKSLPRRFAILFHTTLSVSGVAFGFLLIWKIAVVNFLSAFLLWWYSNNLKRLPFVGNFAVAILTAASILIVNLLSSPIRVLVLIYAAFSFSITLVREVIKDMEDLRGDKTFGCKTLPIVWGVRRTKVYVFAVITLFSVAVLYVHFFISTLPLIFFSLFLFLPLAVLLYRLVAADTVKDFYNLSQWCKAILFLGILSVIAV